MEELAEGIYSLPHQEFNFIHEFFFHSFAKLRHLKLGIIILVGKNISSIIRVFQDQLELLDVAGYLELAVYIFVEEAFTE